jgi:hypothetical protein
VENLVDVARPWVRHVLRHELVHLTAHLHGADPGRLRQATVHRLRLQCGGGTPVPGPGMHVRDNHEVTGVGGAEAPQLLQRALSELQVTVDPSCVEQAAPVVPAAP